MPGHFHFLPFFHIFLAIWRRAFWHSLILDIIRQYSTWFGNIRHYTTISCIILHFWTILDIFWKLGKIEHSTIFNIRHYWTLFDNIQQYSTLFDNIKNTYWTKPRQTSKIIMLLSAMVGDAAGRSPNKCFSFPCIRLSMNCCTFTLLMYRIEKKSCLLI